MFLGNRRVVFDYKANNVEGIPDGMCVDSDGNLWVATFDAGKVRHKQSDILYRHFTRYDYDFDQVIRVNPTTGKLIDQIDLPSPKITSVAFGGPNLDNLYVTSANYGMSADEIARTGAGSLYKVTGTGAKGLSPGVAFAGKV